MNIYLLNSRPHRPQPSAGFTLLELLVSVGLGVVVIGVIVSISIVTSWNYVATYNYVKMEDQSRNALDIINREIRNCTDLVSYSNGTANTASSFLKLTNDYSNYGVTFSYDGAADTLTMAKTGESTRTLLTQCDNFSFQLFNRVPNIGTTNFTFYASTNGAGAIVATLTKVINMNWKCSRTILGSKLNTEIVQTAQVVLRNKID